MSVNRHSGDGCQGACCLRVTGLGVVAQGKTILRSIDLHVHCGQIVALIGPNGAGKSTLFKAILGQQPHTGTIEFERSGGKKTRPPLTGESPSACWTSLWPPGTPGPPFCPCPRECGRRCASVWPGSTERG